MTGHRRKLSEISDLTDLARTLLQHGPQNQRPANRRVRLLFPDPSADTQHDTTTLGSSCIADTTSAQHVWESHKYPFFYLPPHAFVTPPPGMSSSDTPAHPEHSEHPRRKSTAPTPPADKTLEAKAAAYAAGAKDVSLVTSSPAPDAEALAAAAAISAAVKSDAAIASSAISNGNSLTWRALDHVEGSSGNVGATIWSVALQAGRDTAPTASTNRVISFFEGPLRNLTRWEFGAGKWLEEDTPISIHPHDPFKRIDLLNSTRPVTITIPRPPHVPFPFPGSTPDALLATFKSHPSLSATSQALGAASNRASLAKAAEAADSTLQTLPPTFPPSINLTQHLPLAHADSCVHLLETSLPTRYYVPLTGILAFQQGNSGAGWWLRRSRNADGSFVTTGCPYKGTAEYYDVVIRGPAGSERGGGLDVESARAALRRDDGDEEEEDEDEEMEDDFEKVPRHPGGASSARRSARNTDSAHMDASSAQRHSRSTFLASPPPHGHHHGHGDDEGEGELVLRELIWFYENPKVEVGGIAGLCCFLGERVEVWVGGVRV